METGDATTEMLFSYTTTDHHHYGRIIYLVIVSLTW